MSRGLALRGTVWRGGADLPTPDCVVLVDVDGKIARIGASSEVALPDDVDVIGSVDSWIGPGMIDAHVHLGFASVEAELQRGLVAVRDLGAPSELLAGWRAVSQSEVAAMLTLVASGPILTAPGGYPSKSWGAQGYARFVDSPDAARSAVDVLASEGADLVKVALEPTGGAPVPSLGVVQAIVAAAHHHGLAVTAHALSAAMVTVALDAGVDELCHVPVERLTDAEISRIVEAGVPVVSTIETLSRSGSATDNAARLVAAGGILIYGTDLGNAGTRAGVDARELRRLSAAGLGPLGALRAATAGAANAAGLKGKAGSGRLEAGELARITMLAGNPLDPAASDTLWQHPTVIVGPHHLPQFA